MVLCSRELHSPNVEVFGETGAPSTAEETEGHGGECQQRGCRYRMGIENLKCDSEKFKEKRKEEEEREREREKRRIATQNKDRSKVRSGDDKRRRKGERSEKESCRKAL